MRNAISVLYFSFEHIMPITIMGLFHRIFNYVMDLTNFDQYCVFCKKLFQTPESDKYMMSVYVDELLKNLNSDT